MVFRLTSALAWLYTGVDSESALPVGGRMAKAQDLKRKSRIMAANLKFAILVIPHGN
ncbi:hypothetical protein [Pseudomonas fluorescens]|uniref:hypothetical protein n=1 Tax=Pseudomonas fluorescens TaxID=294 RepID=UPI00156178F7|nr:hypothetical protein [Pseudomonas fluorescens]